MSEIQHGGHPLRLLPEGAAYDPEHRWLFVADLHLGKAAALRDSGIGVPDGSDAESLDALSQLADQTGAERVIILGDVFHAACPSIARVAEAFHAWRKDHHPIKWSAVPGNHDRRAPLAEWMPDASLLPEATRLGPWDIRHHPPDLEEPPEIPILCGHLHPGIGIGPRRQKKIHLPCFWMRRGTLILPAFGAFTGSRTIRREKGDSVWVGVEGRIVAIPA